MRVLHVGWGFSDWRPGGLIAYAEDLMTSQLERGHEVSYFLSGRHYPYVSGPRLKRWRRRGVAMHEVINPPIIAGLEGGTHEPELDIAEPRFERAFERVLRSVRPDVVHVQELHGLPSSLLELTARARVPTVMTLHDYGPLCATLRLFDAEGRICMRREVGHDCVARNADAPLDAGGWVDMTLGFEVRRALRVMRLSGLDLSFLAPLVKPLRRHAVRSTWRMDPGQLSRFRERPDQRAARAIAFQRRRDANVERLGRVDRLIAQSPRVAEVYRQLGVPDDRMCVLPAPARHIERLRPRQLNAPPSPVTFATLNGFASPSKGSETLLRALHELRAAGLEGSFRLRAHGYVDEAIRDRLRDYDGVELRGKYERDELDNVLQDVDVGILPSMWEEAYGYTGLEMVAKGIPLIANPLGGIVMYAREGTTAWLNSACSGEGLAELMAHVVRDPRVVVEMHHRTIAARDELFTPWNDHFEAIEAVYGDLVAANGP